MREDFLYYIWENRLIDKDLSSLSAGTGVPAVLSGSAPRVCFTARVNTYTLQRPTPSGRGGSTAASPRRTQCRCRNINRLSIGLAVRLSLRDRLTPGRLTSPGKPWSYGGRDSHPPYRYLCLHLLFMTLQHASQHAFNAVMNAPLPMTTTPSHAFGAQLIPDYYPCLIPRLVSCYALFE